MVRFDCFWHGQLVKINNFSLCVYGISVLILVLLTIGQIFLIYYVMDLKIVYKTMIEVLVSTQYYNYASATKIQKNVDYEDDDVEEDELWIHELEF
jgi:hypothetical protein